MHRKKMNWNDSVATDTLLADLSFLLQICDEKSFLHIYIYFETRMWLIFLKLLIIAIVY